MVSGFQRYLIYLFPVIWSVLLTPFPALLPAPALKQNHKKYLKKWFIKKCRFEIGIFTLIKQKL
jgi:hypothetical protein